ncbi:hypothetical protein B0T19DRAFT_443635 [Cercophora scortea]|uniref:Uncharacterized protein n=1 Tax=Cercophora scortea TaxID=314031 RepID=A0AAE0IFH1_9PEZI|nr:hypothetical protein B0T19DRAFT_443635 [Cercophora scortea]
MDPHSRANDHDEVGRKRKGSLAEISKRASRRESTSNIVDDDDDDERQDDEPLARQAFFEDDDSVHSSDFHPTSEDEEEEDEEEAAGGSPADHHGTPSSSQWSPRKRALSCPSPDERPFKRVKDAMNPEYLDLLNTDIQDAAARLVPHGGRLLSSSQIGLTVWTDAEKQMLFETLSRLGGDCNAAKIAARIRTKGELEVAQYLSLLQDSLKARKQAGLEVEPIVPADLPAAVELSQACCHALEQAADSISLLQEADEEAAEKKLWGAGSWLITPANCREVEEAPPPNLESIKLFRARTWLTVSDRIFMNASFPEYNWRSVAAEAPAIRATALEDFHSLAVSITRRLVAATIYVSESRIRAKRQVFPGTGNLVWKQDVEAAVLSLGLKPNSAEFWTGCARRLRLDVFDDSVGDEEQEPMSYDEVERALGGDRDVDLREGEGKEEEDEIASSLDEDEDEIASALSETPSIDEKVEPLDEKRTRPEDDDDDEEEDEKTDPETDIDNESIKREADELTVFSAVDYPPTAHARRALRAQIRSARRHEAYADALDARASYLEEKRLWDLLHRDPPHELPKVKDPGSPPRKPTQTLEDVYLKAGGGGTVGGDGTGVASNWELEAQVQMDVAREMRERRELREELSVLEMDDE